MKNKKKCAGSSTEHTRQFVIGTSKIHIYEDIYTYYISFAAYFIKINVCRRRRRRHYY